MMCCWMLVQFVPSRNPDKRITRVQAALRLTRIFVGTIQRRSRCTYRILSSRFLRHGKFLLAFSRRVRSSTFNANRPRRRCTLRAAGRCEKRAPLAFRLWQPRRRLVPGVWNIPIPADGDEVSPDIVVAPVVGFDRAGYRLGYGGGFFDRTLASFLHRPLAVGVGYDAAAISTIYPLPHDVPMEAIVTESGILRTTSECKIEGVVTVPSTLMPAWSCQR